MLSVSLAIALLGAPAAASTPPTTPAPPPNAAQPPATVAPEVFAAHVRALVDERAARCGGPKASDDDPRLQVLRAMVATHAAQPSMPLPAVVHAARSLEGLWGGSSALYVIELMDKIAQVRPSGQATSPETCAAVCAAITRTAGDDTVQGLTQAGWPMPAESAAAIREAARATAPLCAQRCAVRQVPNATCVAGIKSQAELNFCWQAPKAR